VVEQIRFVCHIEKSEPDQRRFWGRGYIHTRSDGSIVEDVSGDVVDDLTSQRELENAFYKYVTDYRSGDMEHEAFDAATMIEGFVVTGEKKKAGLFPTDMDEGVYVGFQANDTDAGEALWEGVKTGRLKALSIVGEGTREAI
jgi:hypothetical protein